jgi:hypothetical protein
MDVAKGDLEEHQGYCGTRTENCARCGLFIMVKDMAQHEKSRCNRREIQPTISNITPLSIPSPSGKENSTTARKKPAPRAADTPDDFLFGSGEMNSFQMDEIQRLLGANGLGPSHQTGMMPSSRSTGQGSTQATTSRSKKREINIGGRNGNVEVNHNQNQNQGRYRNSDVHAKIHLIIARGYLYKFFGLGNFICK